MVAIVLLAKASHTAKTRVNVLGDYPNAWIEEGNYGHFCQQSTTGTILWGWDRFLLSLFKNVEVQSSVLQLIYQALSPLHYFFLMPTGNLVVLYIDWIWVLCHAQLGLNRTWFSDSPVSSKVSKLSVNVESVNEWREWVNEGNYWYMAVLVFCSNMQSPWSCHMGTIPLV